MKNINTELLVNLYNKVREVCIAKYGVDMDSFNINEDGAIICHYISRHSYADEEYYDISIEDLNNENLDYLIKERQAKEEAAKLKLWQDREIAAEKQLKRDKEERKRLFEKLKQEFEQ
jgi:hypothetical protein